MLLSFYAHPLGGSYAKLISLDAMPSSHGVQIIKWVFKLITINMFKIISVELLNSIEPLNTICSAHSY